MKTSAALDHVTGTCRDHFVHLTPGKLMGLRQITDANDCFRVLALDQSNSFKKALRAFHEKAGRKAEPAYEELRDAKLDMVRELAAQASAVLLDVNFGLLQALSSFTLPRGIGLVARVEASRDAGFPGEFEPGWSVAQIKRMGAGAVKVLVYMDTEDRKATEAQLDFVRRVSEDCRREDILLMAEELSCPRAGEDRRSSSFVKRKPANILESARLLGPHADILKLEFPGDIQNDSPKQLEENLARLNEAAIRPWVLLSAGERFDLFVRQAERAMAAGCSGYTAGRAIFSEYFEQTSQSDRIQFLRTAGLDRMRLLNRIVGEEAIPWTKRYGIKGEELANAIDPLWYMPEKRRGLASAKGEY